MLDDEETMDFSNRNIDAATEGQYSKDSDDNAEGPMLGVNVEDIREVMAKLGTNLTEEETDLLYRLNGDIKEINPNAYVYSDKETSPGVCIFMIDCCETLLYYFKLIQNGDAFDIEVYQMKPDYLTTEKRADKRFGDWIQSKSGFKNVDYGQLMEILRQHIGEKPLLENFRRMKKVLAG